MCIRDSGRGARGGDRYPRVPAAAGRPGGRAGTGRRQSAAERLRSQRRQPGEKPMSAAENRTTTQAAYQAFANADLDGAMQHMADDIALIVPGNLSLIHI